jgi:hypothetical protein
MTRYRIRYKFPRPTRLPLRRQPLGNVRRDLPTKHPLRVTRHENSSIDVWTPRQYKHPNRVSQEDECLRTGEFEEHGPFTIDDLYDNDTYTRDHRTYADKQRVRHVNWTSVTTDMPRIFSEEFAFEDFAKCVDCDETAEYRCVDCGPRIYYCHTHRITNHRNQNILHRQHTRKSLHPAPILPPSWVSSLITDKTSHNKVHQRLILCLYMDRKQWIDFTFHSDEKDAYTLLRYRLFPATPENPVMAFSLDVLEFFKKLLLEGQIAYDAFTRTLGNIYAMKGDCEPLLESTTRNFSDAFQRYVEVTERLSLHQILETQWRCSACTKVEISLQLSFVIFCTYNKSII